MMLANIVSCRRGILSSRQEEKLFKKLLLPVLFVRLKAVLVKKELIIASMKKDKKRTGQKLPLVMIDDRLKARRVDDLEEEEIKFALGRLALIIK
jgi:3-dehydroquinate synthetase